VPPIIESARCNLQAMSEPAPHSALYLGDWRDHWWDHASLSAWLERAGLAEAREIADLGCGQGHWGMLLWRLLGGERSVHFVDREPRWIEVLEGRVRRGRDAGLYDGRYTAQVGDAQLLPFDDASMDLVSAQTLLIHVAEPLAVLRECRRVLRPGGKVLLSEPNNLGNAATALAPEMRSDPDGALRELAFCARCEVGKARLGLGFNSVGEDLPRLLCEAGFVLEALHQNDRPSVLAPPYASPGQQAEIGLMRDFVERGIYGWERDEAERYFVAGGGTGFDAEYSLMLERDRRRLAEIDAGRFARARGQVGYLAIASRS
jgi:SAM-dependent methyltransferase